MNDYKFFEKLKGKNIKPSLSQREKDEIWNSIRGKLYEKKKRSFPFFKVLAIAAAVLLFFGIGFISKFKLKEKKPIFVSQKESIPMIETYEGNPEIIYETQVQDLKVAFVVDSNIEW